MSQIQILDADFGYALTGQKASPPTTPKASVETEQVVPLSPESELHPWLKNSFLGSMIGGVAGTGTAVAVSRFLDKPLSAINKAKVGGLQGVFAGASGAVAASFAPDRTTGTVVGGLTGATVGALQALAVSPTKGKIIIGAITGLVSGAAAGHVTVAWREYQQKKALDAVGPVALEQTEAPYDENTALILPFPISY